MRLRHALTTALATAGVLVLLAGCTAPAPVLPPGSTAAPISPTTPVETPEPSGPLEPSTTVVSASAVDSLGFQRYPVLEENVLDAVGALPDSPTSSASGNVKAVVAIEEAGGARPTDEYLLNLSYRMCADVMALTSQNMSLADAVTKVMSELPATIGFQNDTEAALVSAYASAMGTGYSYICVPLMDPRAQADLEQGVYRG